MTSNAVQRPQIPGALRVAAAWARLRCSALHPGPRRSQRDPRDSHHGLLVHHSRFQGFRGAKAAPTLWNTGR